MLMTKLIVIFYTAFLFVSGDRLFTPYAVLFLLLYLCMAIAICLIKPCAWRRGIVLLALVFTVGLSVRAHPAFLFLLPPVIFDVLSEYAFHRYFFCLFVFVPVLFVPFSDLPFYAAITLFCLAIFVLAHQSGVRLKKYEAVRQHAVEHRKADETAE